MAELSAWWRKGRSALRTRCRTFSNIFKNVRRDCSSYEFTHSSANVFAIGSILLPGRFEVRPNFKKAVVVQQNYVKIFCFEFIEISQEVLKVQVDML